MRQFVILLVAGVILFITFKITDLSLFIVSAIIIGGGAAILAFFRVNGQPMHMFLLHFMQTVKDPSLRVWKKKVSKRDVLLARRVAEEKVKEGQEANVIPTSRPTVTSQKLAELSLVVDTGGAYRGERGEGNELFD